MTLLYHRSTSALNTKVETKRGVVTLLGKASNAGELNLATKLVNDVNDVKGVKKEKISLRWQRISVSRKEHTMRNFVGWLVLATLLPFIVGFGDVPPKNDVPPEKNIEPVAVKETILFPQDQLFYPPMASPKEPRSHITYLRLNLPLGTVSKSAQSGLAIASAWYAGPAGVKRTHGSSASAGLSSPSSIWTPIPWT